MSTVADDTVCGSPAWSWQFCQDGYDDLCLLAVVCDDGYWRIATSDLRLPDDVDDQVAART